MSAVSTPLIEIAGTPLPQDLVPMLVEAQVDDTQRLPDRFVLRFRDNDRILIEKSHAAVGAEVTVKVLLGEANTPTTLIKGEITALEAEFGSTGSFTVLRGYDPGHRLFRARRTEAYLQMTASDIAAKVAQRCGLRVGTIDATTTVYEQVSQFGCTDWQFLERLARENSREVSVRDGEFSFTEPTQAQEAPATQGRPRTDALALHLGTDLLRVRSTVTAAQQVKEVEVRGWDVGTKQPLTATQAAATTTVEVDGASPAEVARAFGDQRYVATETPYGTQAEVEVAAAAIGAEISSGFAELEAVARGNPALRAGAAVSITGLGKPFDGKYTITTSRHRFDPGTGYTTLFTVTGRSDRTLLALAGGGGADQRTPGVVSALVTDVNDPERLGRVKLRMPWLSEDWTSPWARTVHAGAGKDRGFQVLPEVGDEVLVAFEQGDTRQPYVLGGLYNGVDAPPSHTPPAVDSGIGEISRRSMVSRLGHRIDLLDSSGKDDGILLNAGQDKVTLRLDAASTKITVHSDGEIVLDGSKGVTVNASSAKLDVKAGRMALKATDGIEIDGGAGPVKVSAGANLELKGMSATLHADTSLKVDSGAMCQIQSTLVKIN